MAMPYPAYGGQQQSYPPTFSSNNSFKHPADDMRGISRTPSPTPSEAKQMNESLFSWKQLTNWRFWIRKEWTKYYIILTVIMVITALISIYHHQIVQALTPVTKWLHDLKFGWLVPIGVLFVISFPPLFGHEIVAILCGLVWGLWIGFAIVCAGTFLGEVGNFYAFKWCCRARGEKMERTQISYACLARCVRTGGFKIALIARFSAIPGHFTTAVFSTCGMNIFVFSIAAILSLPKQFITVYLGVILEASDAGTEDTKSKIISDSVLAATFLVTILAMWYIFHQMSLAKPLVIYERRKARQGKMQGVNLDLYANPNDAYSPRGEHEHEHQQWDAQGRAVGYTPGPGGAVMYAPQPTRGFSGVGAASGSGSGGGAGRTPIQADSVYHAPGTAEVYAHGRAPAGREATSDEVGWDMQMQTQQMQMRQRSPPQQQQHQYTTSPPQPQPQRQYTGQQQQQQPQRQYMGQQQQQQQHVEPGTPTQAQYATYQVPPSAASTTLAYLRSPFDDPSHTLEPSNATFGGGHTAEPTDMSYHTAYGSEDSHDDLVPSASAAARAASPPPPSYRTNVR
ncbi:hypothetical protein B0H14DRAFT_1148573 [Mycena olivaceomarginata]|nr:hypothetical protein B0H14DRAFT_1148573 [Mycena olivaceomarginata]